MSGQSECHGRTLIRVGQDAERVRGRFRNAFVLLIGDLPGAFS
jgi:hypothetical protein